VTRSFQTARRSSWPALATTSPATDRLDTIGLIANRIGYLNNTWPAPTPFVHASHDVLPAEFIHGRGVQHARGSCRPCRSLKQRLQQGVQGVRVELHVDSGGHFV
jgi:hypothetical protein